MWDRVRYSLDRAGLTLPGQGPIALFGADAPFDALPPDRAEVIQPFKPAVTVMQAAGYRCLAAPQGPYAAAIVSLPRARDRAQDWIAQACAATPGGLVVVDGAKTDGADALLKAVRARVPVDAAISKAHGKCFWFTAGPQFEDWRQPPRPAQDGFWTAPGVFSADGPDKGSLALLDALAEAMPAGLHGAVADLGAGWGFLTRALLASPEVRSLHAVEADGPALDCAQRAIADPRVTWHWADATTWLAPQLLDAVVMNPPFHTGRTSDPALGAAFIAAAARQLSPRGVLWMVANRHLPYEAALNAAFRTVEERPGTAGFKIFRAAHPLRTRP